MHCVGDDGVERIVYDSVLGACEGLQDKVFTGNCAGVSAVGVFNPDAQSRKIGRAETIDDTLHAVVSGGAATGGVFVVSDAYIQIIVYHDYIARINIIKVHDCLHRAPGVIHIRVRFGKHHGRAVACAVLCDMCVAFFVVCKRREIPPILEQINKHKTDIVACVVITFFGITQSDNEFHMRVI